MIIIENENDVERLKREQKPTPIIAKFLLDYIHFITKDYPKYKLSDYGAFFFLESQADCDLHEVLHLSMPVLETCVEFSEKIRIINTSGDTEKVILHFCVICNNDFGVSCFSELGTLNSATEEYLLQQQLPERSVTVDV